MGNLVENNNWPEGVPYFEANAVLTGGPDCPDNIPIRALADRSRYQRLRAVTPWSATLAYPADAYVSFSGTTWRSIAPSTNVPPNTDGTKWVRWGHTSAELSEALHSAVGQHEGKEDPHPLYAFRSGTSSVPLAFVGDVILVRTPHLRHMVWDGAKYVRAPWHQPGMVLYSYDNPSGIPGYLPVRADLSYSQANYPDLVQRLGLSGSGTFSLVELRGEFIRCLDNGRGVNAGRGLRTAEAGDNRPHTHPVNDPKHNHAFNDPGHTHSAWTDAQGNHTHRLLVYKANDFNSGSYATGSDDPWDGGAWVNGTEAAGNHGHNVGVGPAGSNAWLSAASTGISVGSDGSESRPRNLAFPAWVSY